MCGICGFINAKNLAIQDNVIPNMLKAMSHRGPDAEGIFSEGNFHLGHRRLSIIDVGEQSNQPFFSDDGNLVMVFNGEIYNYKKLYAELDYPFKTNSDTEVILAAYKAWGIEFLNRLNGMFAIAIYDKSKKELFIARDRLGIKPIYYSYENGRLVYSSEMKSLLASEAIPRKLDKKSLQEYLSYQSVNAPNTIIENVKMLLPGSYMIANELGFSLQSYWTPEEKIESASFQNKTQVKEKVRELFFAAVNKRLVADVPIGAFLSGGIDSSAVVAVMSKISELSPNTFSVVFEEELFSEEKYANIVAAKFKTNHHTIRLRANTLMEEIPQALQSMDHPSGDGINTYIVSKVTKEAGITVALSGLGGDEIFSGYPIFRQLNRLNSLMKLNHLPSGLKSSGGKLLGQLLPSVSVNKIKQLLASKKIDFQSFYPLSRQLFLDKDLLRILNFPLKENAVRKIVEEKFKNPFFFDSQIQTKVSILEFSTYMQNVLLKDADQMSMANSLEIRVPFLDHELVEYMLNVDEKLKLESFPKSLLVESLDGLLPKEVYERKKMGFVLPWEIWLRTDLKNLVLENLAFLSAYPSINSAHIQKIWEDFNSKSKEVNWTMIWSLTVLGNWLKQNRIEE